MPVRLTPAADVPEGARVCHYDELEEPVKDRLPDVAGGTTADPAFDRVADAVDLVKFTDYYRVERC